MFTFARLENKKTKRPEVLKIPPGETGIGFGQPGNIAEVHNKCRQHGREPNGHIDYVKGANIAGFVKVADAMLAYGVV